jgi:hypothetical protein
MNWKIVFITYWDYFQRGAPSASGLGGTRRAARPEAEISSPGTDSSIERTPKSDVAEIEVGEIEVGEIEVGEIAAAGRPGPGTVETSWRRSRRDWVRPQYSGIGQKR